MPSPERLEAVIERLRRAERPILHVDPDPGDVRTVALLPGSFDPPTVAHAALAEAALGRADTVVAVYSVRALPKEGPVPPPLLSEPDRLAALRRFCVARPGVVMGLCSHGLLAEQARAARARFPRAGLWLVMGSDKVLQLLDPRWYGDRDSILEGLFADAGVLYAVRAGEEEAVEQSLVGRENVRWRGRFELLAVQPEAAAISSREVRERLARGEDASHLVPAEIRPLLGARNIGRGPGH